MKRKRWKMLVALSMLVSTLVLVAVACGESSSPTSEPRVVGTQPAAPSTPTPTQQQGQKHFTVGEKVALNGYVITVTSFKRFKPTNDFEQPKAGNQYVVADLTIVNQTGDTQSLSSVLSISLRDAAGQSYDRAYVSDVPTAPEGTVPNGGQVKGSVAYEVPQSQTKFTLTYQAEFLNNAIAIWDLSL